MHSACSIARETLEDTRFWTHENCPFHAHLTEGDPDLLVIGGANATGKSVLFEFIAGVAKREANALSITISIRERTGAGTFEMSGMRRSMMFGDEHEQSTGATSVSVVQRGFDNLQNRERPVMLMLDEPDLGLSADYAYAMGAYIGQRTREVSAQLDAFLGVVVVTHSRELIRGIQATGGKPSFVSTGEHLSLAQWLESTSSKTVEDLLALNDMGCRLRRETSRLFSELRKEAT